ncbi:TRAP transporter substrate-binding protein [Bradyrhizobium sp.]|uniref:TRAP transporter substrate-binding protein n=1 Tax=Bradyrhizobium sp. TaxID=376 RepID=UPI001EBE4023|nr:TRAP transporter substrate-binding protein [Bradyrhizobium sp.]MBV8918490.1 TRAP transporter substrate-binding protein [Bradyrhizobium sp.]MBV9982621.1 TRAP transporter substrate-binding protein [Bradyrhizobium sp.]
MVTRRSVLLGAISGAAIGGLGIASARAEPISLKVSHYLPPNHTFHRELTKWGESLSEQSQGRLTLNIFPASQLGPVNRQFDLVRNGVVDIAVGLHGATPGRFPMTDLISLPYLAPKAGSNSAVTSHRLTELAPTYLFAEHPGMKILWMAVTNPLMFHTSKRPITKLEDFNGLRVRYAGEQFAQIIPLLGATPLAVPPAETADSLSKGIIDAATFPYEACQSFDLGTAIKYSLEPGVSTATFAVAMNPNKFKALPADLQQMIEQTTGPAMAERFGAAFDASEKAGRAYMLEKGVQISQLADAELSRVKEILVPLLDKALANLEKSGKPVKAFLDAYTA